MRGAKKRKERREEEKKEEQGRGKEKEGGEGRGGERITEKRKGWKWEETEEIKRCVLGNIRHSLIKNFDYLN